MKPIVKLRCRLSPLELACRENERHNPQQDNDLRSHIETTHDATNRRGPAVGFAAGI
jgi:hypothetical protein